LKSPSRSHSAKTPARAPARKEPARHEPAARSAPGETEREPGRDMRFDVARDGGSLLANRKHIMTLFSGSRDPWSHRTRIVLKEKEIECDVVEVDTTRKPRELADINPYNQVPTLVDRDLVLYESLIIMEYLDERLPHPPLMPVDPVSRARARLMLFRFDRDWYGLIRDLDGADKKAATRARTILRDGLTVISPLFKDNPFILGAELSMVDCALAPLLYRLQMWNIELPKQAKPILDYAQRLFDRRSFQIALTSTERELITRAAR
jgi:RNA polymerase-associated protein